MAFKQLAQMLWKIISFMIIMITGVNLDNNRNNSVLQTQISYQGLNEALRVRATEIDKIQNIESFSLYFLMLFLVIHFK